jgi:anti-sigma regulatory factor (Ser/Thr protein kinase)
MCSDVSTVRSRCDLSSPGKARHLCASFLAAELGSGAAATRLIEDVSLVVSELVTNAVTAGATHTVLSLGVQVDQVVVDVWDDAADLPHPRRPHDRDTHGRGLAIVGSVATHWGVRPEPGAKDVWAAFTLPQEVRPPPAAAGVRLCMQ